MKRFSRIQVIAMVLLLCTTAASAQFANARLAGTVSGPDGSGLPGVTVTVTNVDTGISRTTVTLGNGAYVINGIRPGNYAARFELDGFKASEQDGVELRVGQKTVLDAQLELGAVTETISVVSTAPLIETESKEIGGSITTKEFEALPSANRSALLFASLLPGVVPDPSVESTASDALFVNGQDDNNNNFNIDGANNDDDVIGARAGAQTRTSIEAIQEFQVLTTQFDAEFGRATGGVLNAITKSGTNSFRGGAWIYRQDASFDEKDFLAEQAGLPKPDTKFTNQGFNLGGPIVQNKAHFFVNYEDDENNEGVIGNFNTRPDLNFTTTEDNQIENVIAKVDYAPMATQLLSYRYLREESPQFNQIIGNVTLDASREEDDTDSNWIFSWTSTIGNTQLNIARVSFTKEDVSFANPGFNNNGQDFASQRNQDVGESRPGFTTGASTVAQSRINTSRQFDDTFSFVIPEWGGDHEFRVGVNYSEREETFSNFGTLNGIFFNFETDQPFDSADISTYPGSFQARLLGEGTAPIPENDVLGVFAQDDWRVNEKLTLNLGVRYDDEDITDDSNIAPRVGFAWDPKGDGRSAVRGGYGRFYDRFQLGFYSGFFLDSATLSQGFIQNFNDGRDDPQLMFDLAQANGITTLDGLRDFLIAQMEGGAGAVLNRSPTVDNPNRKQPYVDSFSLGYQRQQWQGIAWSVDYIHSENKDTLVTADLNPRSLAQGGRPNLSILNGQQTSFNGITTFVNAGESDYDGLQLSLWKRRTGRWGGRISATLSDTSSNNEGGGGGTASAYFQTRTETGYDFDTGQFIGAPLQLNMDDSRATGQPYRWSRDEHVVVSGQYLVPGTSWRDNEGLLVSGIFRYLSGNRFTVLDNSARLDNNRRAPAAPGTYSGTDPRGRTQTVSFDGGLRGAENPGNVNLDLSFNYTIPIGSRYKLRLLADIFNATDKVNWTSAGGNRVGLGSFLVPTSTQGPRRIQLGARFDF